MISVKEKGLNEILKEIKEGIISNADEIDALNFSSIFHKLQEWRIQNKTRPDIESLETIFKYLKDWTIGYEDLSTDISIDIL